MLKNRILTALILAPVIILAVWYLPPLWFAVIWGLLIAVGAWEWADLAGLGSVGAKLGFVIVLGGIMLTGPTWSEYTFEWLAWPVVAWWFVMGLLIRRIPAKLLAANYPLAVKLTVGLFVLISAWILMVWTRVNFGVIQVLYLLLLVWSADIAAYFTGKRFGVTKLAPEISPGKTVEGLYGAVAITLVFSVAVALYHDYDAIKVVDLAMLSVVTVIFAVTGDLFESLAKRQRGVKDSGALLPGHGGLLDRIDSLLAAVPVFYAGSYLLELFLGAVETVPVTVPEVTGMLNHEHPSFIALSEIGVGLLEALL